MSWRRLRALVTKLPPESALRIEQRGDPWGTTEHLLAAAVDALRAGNWQRGNGQGARPDPVPRPRKADSEPTGQRWGTAIPIDEMRELQDRWRRGELKEVIDGS